MGGGRSSHSEKDQRDAALAHRANISRQLVAVLEAEHLQAPQRANSVADEVDISVSKIAPAKERTCLPRARSASGTCCLPKASHTS